MQYHRPRDRYLAGLWAGSLFMDLLWRAKESWGMPTDNFHVQEVIDQGSSLTLVSRLAGEWRAPSWSWASADGHVYYMLQEDEVETAAYANLVSVNSVFTSPGDESGQLLSAEIVLEGGLIPGTWYERVNPTGPRVDTHLKIGPTDVTAWSIDLENSTRSTAYISEFSYLSLSEAEKEMPFIDRPSSTVSPEDPRVFRLPVSSFNTSSRYNRSRRRDFDLLLHEVEAGCGGEQKYKRVGLAQVDRAAREAFPFEDWPMIRFTSV
ncbi:hypothetical protein B0T26DRAFT_677589 [Lasiosphaeria miniovina]|uniref:Uncharacterized protein n=1 Tax=Lasiosphaeria miniovina TaxID=1954250 RepID=A0AA40ACA5_9PEZI|nr:uncharacterized protein B0T26DRAFT_677589 [Lasiosphaeria miniovina]KAK0713228.1 hypothetical protein B0T26DRAFT_677589 [Lasiosphaeria miniovina]